jgi:hypothetical protein
MGARSLIGKFTYFANYNNGGYAVTDYALRGCAAP